MHHIFPSGNLIRVTLEEVLRIAVSDLANGRFAVHVDLDGNRTEIEPFDTKEEAEAARDGLYEALGVTRKKSVATAEGVTVFENGDAAEAGGVHGAGGSERRYVRVEDDGNTIVVFRKGTTVFLLTPHVARDRAYLAARNADASSFNILDPVTARPYVTNLSTVVVGLSVKK